MNERSPENNRVPSLEALKTQLQAMESTANTELQTSLSQAGVAPDVADRYRKIFPETHESTASTTEAFSWRMLGRKIREGVNHNKLTQAILAGLTVQIGGRVLIEGHGDPAKGLAILLDSLVNWSGRSIQSPDFFTFILAVGTATVYAGGPAKIIEWITTLQSKRTTEQVRLNAEAMAERGKKESEIREGKADLDRKIGPNIQIDVGKSDPAMKDLLTLFHGAGLRVVSYCDSENEFFDADPAWQRTNNDWTNQETLRRGDVREALCSVQLVSNGDDVFLSPESQGKGVQDMTDSEAIGAIRARDLIRKNMGLPAHDHILVSNPRRKIGVGVARAGDVPYQSKTLKDVVEELPNVHLLDPDMMVIRQLAALGAQENLPLELVTNEDRKIEYQTNFLQAIEQYNSETGSEEKRYTARMATEDDGKKTLTVVYGSTDEDTVAQITTYRKEFSEEGGLVAIMNDPEKVSRLPEGVKSICVGTSVAEAVYQKYFEITNRKDVDG